MDSNQNNIKEYYKEVSDKYGISFEEFKLICMSPWNFIKECMASGILKNIRFIYFGTFTISKNRVNYSKKILEEKYSKGEISEKKYLRKSKILNSYEDLD